MYSLGFISNFIISLKLLSQCILVALENWARWNSGPFSFSLFQHIGQHTGLLHQMLLVGVEGSIVKLRRAVAYREVLVAVRPCSPPRERVEP